MTSESHSSTPTGRPLRVAVVYRVCPHWRAPIFARLNAHPDIDLTVFHGRSIPGTKLVNGERLEGFAHRELPTFHATLRAGGRSTVCVLLPTVAWALYRHNPDVIIVEGGSNILSNTLILLYAMLFRKPFVWWTLGELPGRQFLGIRRLYRAMVVAMERRANALLGYSSVAMNYFARMGYPLEKCVRAVNCVETDKVLADIERRRDLVPALRQRLGLENRKVVLFVGALITDKQVDRLVRAFALIRPDAPDARLLIVGDGPDRPQLEALASDLGCADATIFTGQVIEGVSDYFELADVLVLPGLGGLAISEALAHGVPVICTQGDGCEVDLVRNGETGFCLGNIPDEEAVTAIATRLREMLGDPARLDAMRTAARTLIEREVNVETYVQGIVDAVRLARNGTHRRPLRRPESHGARG
jgi:glycosyltransferase involved in cell wall biosynthesis